MRKGTTDLGAGGFMLVFALLFLSRSGGLTGVSWLFPRALIIVMGLGGLYLLITGIFRLRKAEKEEEEEPVAGHRVLFISVLSIVYLLCIPWLGFYASSFLFLFASAMALGGDAQKTVKGHKRAVVSVAFSVLLCVLVWGGFNILLSVPTPAGLLF